MQGCVFRDPADLFPRQLERFLRNAAELYHMAANLGAECGE